MIHDFVESEIFPLDINFSDFLRKKRRLLGLNQTDFGEIFNVERDTISKWELGTTSPPFNKAVEMIEKLGGGIRIINKWDVRYNVRERTINRI